VWSNGRASFARPQGDWPTRSRQCRDSDLCRDAAGRDLYHGRQHLRDTAALLHPHDAAAKKRRIVPMKDLPDHGTTELLVEWLRDTAAGHAAVSIGGSKTSGENRAA
jgi:hypothetical protein